MKQVYVYPHIQNAKYEFVTDDVVSLLS